MPQWTPPQQPIDQVLPPIPLWLRLAPYIPLIMIGVEIAWILFLILVVLFIVGDKPMNSVPAAEERARTRLFDIVALLPALAGFLFGILAITRRWARDPLAWTCLIVGCVACAIAMLPFLSEFFTG